MRWRGVAQCRQQYNAFKCLPFGADQAILTALITLHVCVMHEEQAMTYLHLKWQRQRVQQLRL